MIRMKAMALPKSKKPSALATLTALPFLMILTGCLTDQTPPPAPTAATQTDTSARPLACTEFAAMMFQNGKPGATPADVDAIMKVHPEDPIGYVRGLLGDTVSTMGAISDYQAARKKLGCE
jgi:hypothetical protein